MRFRIKKRNVTVWKVLHRMPNGDLVSGLYDQIPRSWRVIYAPGRWTFPQQKGTGLFAFDRMKTALSWSVPNLPREIWRCSAHILDGELAGGGRTLKSRSFGIQTLLRFWRKPQGFAGTYLNRAPAGGIWCSRLKLVKCVRRDY
jgi:hypothetical protein